MIDFFEEVPEYDVDMYTNKKNKTNAEKSLPVLQELLPVIEAQEDFTNDALYEMLVSFAKGHEYKNGYVMWPVRTAVSGKQMTPGGATELMELLGKDIFVMEDGIIKKDEKKQFKDERSFEEFRMKKWDDFL